MLLKSFKCCPWVVQLLFCVLFSNIVTAQKFDDQFFRENLLKTSYAIDSDADAVVLYENVGSEIVDRGFGEQRRKDDIFHIHRIVKILKPAALSDADIHVPYFFEVNHYEGYIRNISAITYNLKAGKLVVDKLTRDDIYKQSLLKNRVKGISFTLPDVKVGSIIEYDVEVSKGITYYLPSWHFQDKYPKLVSEYELISPKTMVFNGIVQGYQKFTDYKNKKEAGKGNATAYHIVDPELTNNRYKVVWGIKNVPAYHNEVYANNDNHKELLELQLSYSDEGYDVDDANILTTWEKLDDMLIKDEDFGKRIKNTAYMKPEVDRIVDKAHNKLEKAHLIFDFVRRHYTANDTERIFSFMKIEDVYKHRAGTEAEINMVLTGMLHEAGLNAAPVVLSHGPLRVSAKYPVLSRLNYTASMVKIDSEIYLLDASDKFNRFGTLSPNCYDGYARIVDYPGMGLMLSPQVLDEKNLYYITVSGFDADSLSMVVAEKIGNIASDSVRRAYDKDQDAIKKIINKEAAALLTNSVVTNLNITNLDNPDTNLIIQYTLKQKNDKNVSHIYFPTDVFKSFSNNPFAAKTRKYPIEFPYQIHDTYIMNVQVPDDWEVQDIPQPVQIKYEDDMALKHIVAWDAGTHLLSVHSNMSVNNTVYPAASYDDVNNFFNKMAKEENSIITFTKK